MISRCYNPKDNAYKYYGDRNIQVCDEWKNSFESFFQWAINNGWQKELTLDRRENNHGYHPLNCRFVTMQVQAENKKRTIFVSHNGLVKTVAQAAKDKGIHPGMIYHRIKKGVSGETALLSVSERRKQKKDLLELIASKGWLKI